MHIIMGFNLAKFWDDFTSTDGIGAIFNNPIITAVIIVILIMIIVYCVFYDAYHTTTDAPSFWRLMLRTGFYTSLVVVSFVSLYYKQTSDNFEKSKKSESLSDVVDQAITPQIMQGTVGTGEYDELFPDDEIITGEKLVVLNSAPNTE